MANRIPQALVRSLAAGVIAGIIYAIISAVEHTANAKTIAVGAVLLGLFTLVIAFIITLLISSVVTRRT